MANKYVSTISSILQQYDHSRLDKTYYDALAWGGLLKTKAWKELPQKAIDTIAYKNRIAAEDYGSSEAQGNKCN